MRVIVIAIITAEILAIKAIAVSVVGEDYRGLNLHFAPANHNFVSVVELMLRKSFLRPLMFETPLFNVYCAGAKVWYWIWYHLLTGHKLRDQILADPKYGPQWMEETWAAPDL